MYMKMSIQNAASSSAAAAATNRSSSSNNNKSSNYSLTLLSSSLLLPKILIFNLLWKNTCQLYFSMILLIFRRFCYLSRGQHLWQMYYIMKCSCDQYSYPALGGLLLYLFYTFHYINSIISFMQEPEVKMSHSFIRRVSHYNGLTLSPSFKSHDTFNYVIAESYTLHDLISPYFCSFVVHNYS